MWNDHQWETFLIPGWSNVQAVLQGQKCGPATLEEVENTLRREFSRFNAELPAYLRSLGLNPVAATRDEVEQVVKEKFPSQELILLFDSPLPLPN